MNTLFLDLEETLIEEFIPDFFVIPNRIEEIRHFISENDITEICVWSWAVWSDDDTTEIMDCISAWFGLPCDIIPVDEAVRLTFPTVAISSDDDVLEIISMHTKATLLFMHLSQLQHHKKCFLLDDTVNNQAMIEVGGPTLFVINIENIGATNA